jgi:hypothetical protein
MMDEEHNIWEKKRQHRQQHLSQEQKMKRELNSLPQGEQLLTWIAGHIQKRLDGVPQVLWRIEDQRQMQVSFINGQTDEVLITTVVNRQEIAQMRAMQSSWINQLVAQIRGEEEEGHESSMHEKFEQQMSSQYEDMMEKLTGKND